MFINISLRILGATMFPFMSSMIYLFFMFFSDMMEPIFFMNEFFAALMTFYNCMMVYMSCVSYQFFIALKFFATLITHIHFMV